MANKPIIYRPCGKLYIFFRNLIVSQLASTLKSKERRLSIFAVETGLLYVPYNMVYYKWFKDMAHGVWTKPY